MPLIAPVVAVGCIAAAAMGQAPVQNEISLGQPLARQRGVLLLRNGQVLEGDIAKVGERYSIAVDRGEIRLHQRDVESVCRDIEDAYRQKCLQSREDCVQDHLDLAQWCQSHGLLNQASQELRVAIALNPTHPLIPLIDRKIQMSAQRQAMPANQLLAAEGNPQPSAEELDRMVRGMPNGAVEVFTQTIQPMLTNTCTASDCHGPNSADSFRLLRIPSGRPPSRRLTQRNLHAVIEQIDWKDPPNSLLLTAPIKPHGTSKTAIFTDRQIEQYQELVRWVYLVAMGRRIEVEKPKEVVAAAHLENVPLPKEVMHADHELPWADSAFPSLQGEPSPASADAAPIDVFDAEMFNRRFAPEPPATEENQ